MSEYIIDACALIAVLNKEEGAEFTRDLINQANEGDITISMNIINLLEVYYGIRRELGNDIASKVLFSVRESSINIIETISQAVFEEAGRLKSTYKISLADSLALAEASLANAFLLTSDHHEFDIIEKSENIKFNWIR
ncbi:MAG: PIN domain-containing protein [Oscillospiraceae bacterium]|jgi:predicted nucleic acid-binding protein|nr:PIN domain-containing protein [Oscillospiraceae bacterium]